MPQLGICRFLFTTVHGKHRLGFERGGCGWRLISATWTTTSTGTGRFNGPLAQSQNSRPALLTPSVACTAVPATRFPTCSLVITTTQADLYRVPLSPTNTAGTAYYYVFSYFGTLCHGRIRKATSNGPLSARPALEPSPRRIRSVQQPLFLALINKNPEGGLC